MSEIALYNSAYICVYTTSTRYVGGIDAIGTTIFPDNGLLQSAVFKGLFLGGIEVGASSCNIASSISEKSKEYNR